MRTEDILALCNHPCAEHRRAFQRRKRAVIGAILAAVLIGTALVRAYLPPAQAFITNTDESELSAAKTLSAAAPCPVSKSCSEASRAAAQSIVPRSAVA
jgi:hypothetical protein